MLKDVMSDDYSKVLIPLIRQLTPELVARDLVDVQRMDGSPFRNLYEFLNANRHLSVMFTCDKTGVTNA